MNYDQKYFKFSELDEKPQRNTAILEFVEHEISQFIFKDIDRVFELNDTTYKKMKEITVVELINYAVKWLNESDSEFYFDFTGKYSHTSDYHENMLKNLN